jgi:hypothetical protein
MWITCFATDTPDRPIVELELCHRLRARAEDRIRAARVTGLRQARRREVLHEFAAMVAAVVGPLPGPEGSSSRLTMTATSLVGGVTFGDRSMVAKTRPAAR